MPVSKPQVLLLQLAGPDQDDLFNDLYTGLCNRIEKQYRVIKTDFVTTEHLAHSKAVIVPDGDVSKKKRKRLQIMLSEYAKVGGTVIFACLFSNTVCPPDFDRMCRNMDLPWSYGDYHRTDFALNPALAPVLGLEAFEMLEQSYSVKALHLENCHPAAKVYVPMDGSRTQSYVFPPDPVDAAQTPAAWQQHGQGHIAYIGDVNNESGSQALIMAMLDKCCAAAKGGPRQDVADEFADLPALLSGCEACGKASPVRRCAGCRKVQYCSVDCQKADWKSHKAHC